MPKPRSAQANGNGNERPAVTVRIEGEPKPLVLVGFMACGKSRIGAGLAEQLRMPFVDTDKEIERLFGMTVQEIFRTKGESAFRDAEQKTILGLLDGQQRVIALGGGAFVNPVTRAKLAKAAHTIWLDPPFDTIRTRLEGSVERPIAAASTDDELRDLWAARRRFYAEANLHVTKTEDDPAQTVENIMKALALR